MCSNKLLALANTRGPCYIDPKLLHRSHNFANTRPIFQFFPEPLSMLKYHQSELVQPDDTSYALVHTSRSINTYMRALLPTRSLLNGSGEHVDFESSLSFTFTKCLVYSTSNNFAGMLAIPMEDVMAVLRHHGKSALLHHIQNAFGPEAEAFLENLFRVAIEFKDAPIVEFILHKGLDPNQVVCVTPLGKCTPIQRSSELGDTEITRLLINAKADVNKTYPYDTLYRHQNALSCALRSHSPSSKPLVELVKLLLQAGSQIETGLLRKVLIQRFPDDIHDSLINLLLDFGAEVERFYFGDVSSALGGIVSKTATRLFKVSMQQHDTCVFGDLHGKYLLSEMIGLAARSANMELLELLMDNAVELKEHFSVGLDTAARLGNMELVRFLVSFGVCLTGETLVWAIRSTNKQLIWFLLDAGADVHGSIIKSSHSYSPTDLPQTALAEAIRLGDVGILAELERRGVWSRLHQGDEAFSVLRAGIDVCDFGLVKKVLFDTNLDVRKFDLWGIIAAEIKQDHEEMVMLLLEFTAAKDSQLVALYSALKKRNKDLVCWLLTTDRCSASRSKPSPVKPVLVEAASWGDHSVMKDLIDLDFDVNAIKGGDLFHPRPSNRPRGVTGGGYTALAVAVTKKDIGLLQLLLSAGADLNQRQWVRRMITPLAAAVHIGDFSMVDYLLSCGADPYDPEALMRTRTLPRGFAMAEKILAAFHKRYPYSMRGFGSAIFSDALWEANFPFVERLLDFGVDVTNRANEGGQSVFDVAVRMEHDPRLEVFSKVLHALGDPDRTVHNQFPRATALLIAIRAKKVAKVQLIIDAGADVNLPATRGITRTPLQSAVEVGSYQLVQLLIEKDAHVNAPPAITQGATAMQLAAIQGYVGIAELLLKHGADVNAPAAKFDGRTALEGAAEHGRIDMLRLLFNAGVSLYGPDGKHLETAVRLAEENGHMATSRYLTSMSQELGGDI